METERHDLCIEASNAVGEKFNGFLRFRKELKLHFVKHCQLENAIMSDEWVD